MSRLAVGDGLLGKTVVWDAVDNEFIKRAEERGTVLAVTIDQDGSAHLLVRTPEGRLMTREAHWARVLPDPTVSGTLP